MFHVLTGSTVMILISFPFKVVMFSQTTLSEFLMTTDVSLTMQVGVRHKVSRAFLR